MNNRTLRTIKDVLGALRLLLVIGMGVVLLALPLRNLSSHADSTYAPAQQNCLDGGFHPAGEAPCLLESDEGEFRLGGVIVLLGLLILAVLWLESKVDAARSRRLRDALEMLQFKRQESRV